MIADLAITEHLLRGSCTACRSHKFIVRPRIIIWRAPGITEVEKRAVIDSAVRAGCLEVLLVREPIAAAIGGSSVDTPTGNMVVDIGGGTTEIRGHRAQRHRHQDEHPAPAATNSTKRSPRTRRRRTTC